MIWSLATVAAPDIFCGGGASRGQNAILRGQKLKNLTKMADFGHFFFWLGESGGQSLRLGGIFPHTPPPWCRHCLAIDETMAKLAGCAWSKTTREKKTRFETWQCVAPATQLAEVIWKSPKKCSPVELKVAPSFHAYRRGVFLVQKQHDGVVGLFQSFVKQNKPIISLSSELTLKFKHF